MQICKVKNYQELSRKAANLIAAQVILKPDSVLGLATGSSPVGTYEHLVEMYENGDLDFSQVTTVNLDEYKGLAGSDEQSYRYFMNTHLFHKININHANTYVPSSFGIITSMIRRSTLLFCNTCIACSPSYAFRM